MSRDPDYEPTVAYLLLTPDASQALRRAQQLALAIHQDLFALRDRLDENVEPGGEEDARVDADRRLAVALDYCDGRTQMIRESLARVLDGVKP